MIPPHDDPRLLNRIALHERYHSVARIGDASRLAYLHGAEQSWSEEEVADLWARGAARQHAIEPLNSVYIHVPFCKSICSFCNYDRLQPSSPVLLENWLARALRTIDVLAPAVQGLTFHALYIGGGTPSVLPARFLAQLLEAVDGRFNWHSRASRKLEFDPAVMSPGRLEVLVAHGFRQLSFGVETLDPEINARHNRGRQGIEIIERCFNDLRNAGLSNVTVDFLLGLEGTTPEGMLVELETVMSRFRPSWLDLFMLTPTKSYIDRHFAGSHDAMWEHLRRFEAVLPPALPALAERTGYTVRSGSGHHMVLERRAAPGEEPTRSDADRSLFYTPLTSQARRPLNVLGIGRSARSTIFGTAAFTARDPDDDPAKSGPISYRGNAIDIADEARTYLAHRLRDEDLVDRDEFRRIFGADITAVLPQALAGWRHEGAATLDDEALRFVPHDRQARIRSLLWLVPQDDIEFDLAHFDQLDLSPNGVAALGATVRIGTDLGAGHTYQGTDAGSLLLRSAQGETLRLRLAPPLSDTAPLRLVLQAAPEKSDAESLRAAVGRLRLLLTHHHRSRTRQRSTAA